MSLLRITLVCECGNTTEGFEVLLGAGGTAPLPCPHCDCFFTIEQLKERPRMLTIDPRAEGDAIVTSEEPPDPSGNVH